MKKEERNLELITKLYHAPIFEKRVYIELINPNRNTITLINALRDDIEWAWQNLKSGYADGRFFERYTDKDEYDPTKVDNLFTFEYLSDYDFEARADSNPEFADENLKELYDSVYNIDTEKADKVSQLLLKKDNTHARKFLLQKIKYDTYKKMYGYYQITESCREEFLQDLKAFIEDRTSLEDNSYYISLY